MGREEADSFRKERGKNGCPEKMSLIGGWGSKVFNIFLRPNT